jgi:hypothetical protein
VRCACRVVTLAVRYRDSFDFQVPSQSCGKLDLLMTSVSGISERFASLDYFALRLVHLAAADVLLAGVYLTDRTFNCQPLENNVREEKFQGL